MNDTTNFELNGFDSAQKTTDGNPAEPNPETEVAINAEAPNSNGVISATFGAPIESEQNTAGFANNVAEKAPQVDPQPNNQVPDISSDNKNDIPPAKESSFSPQANYNLNGNPYGYSVYGTPINNQAPTGTKKPKEKKRFSAATVVVSIICSALIAVASSFLGVAYYLNSNLGGSLRDGSSATEIKNIVVEEEGLSVVEAVYEKCGPSIVGIRTTTSVMSFFGGQEVSGEGSGIIYSSDGYILTNYHVISDSSSSSSYYGGSSGGVASKIDVYLPSDPETAIPATVIGYNISSDLAVIKIDKTGLPAIEVGDSSDINVGQFVIAIGNPGGLQFMGSVTYGVIGGVNRSLEVDAVGTMKLIQTDAAINPGNSGGALVNTEGKLIGINSSKLVDESYEGMGFAIPINEALEICDKIIENKDEPIPYLGVEISTRYTSQVLSYYNYPAGAVIASVDNGSPAYNAGIQRGDIITKFNGVEISEYTLLNDTLRQCRVGDKVEAVIYRSGKYITTEVTIGSSN